jgi:hypothetical protein
LGTITCNSPTYTITSVVGTYPTTCSGAVNANYSITYVAGKLTVTQGRAVMLTPAVGTPLAATNQQFTYTNGGGPSSYSIWIGTTGIGSKNLYVSPATTSLSITANVTIPSQGITVYVRLYTLVAGVALYNDYTYLEPGALVAPVLTPSTGVLSATNQVFTWTAGAGNTSYALYLGTTLGGSNLYLGPTSAALTATVPSLPTLGAKVYARLFYLQGVTWKFTDYTFTESPAVPPVLTPSSGVLSATNQVFTWTAGSGNTSYALYLGTTLGGSNLYLGPTSAALTATVPSLPTLGAKVYARLFYLQGVTWKFTDYTF